MRVTRAVMASLGAGMSIVLMGVGVLAAVSAVVGFSGWPGAAAGGEETPRAMLAQSDPAGARGPASVRPRIVVPDPIRAAAHHARATRSASPRAGVDGIARNERVSERKHDTGTKVLPQRHPAGTPDDDPPLIVDPPDRVVEDVRETGAELGNATDQTVKGLGKAVEPVSPTLAKTVDDVGQVVGDTIQGVTNSVSDLLLVVIKPTP